MREACTLNIIKYYVTFNSNKFYKKQQPLLRKIFLFGFQLRNKKNSRFAFAIEAATYISSVERCFLSSRLPEIEA
jgi:hypothetical protein